jgi:hypothetical protein
MDREDTDGSAAIGGGTRSSDTPAYGRQSIDERHCRGRGVLQSDWLTTDPRWLNKPSRWPAQPRPWW